MLVTIVFFAIFIFHITTENVPEYTVPRTHTFMPAGIRAQFVDIGADIEKSSGSATDTLQINEANTDENSGSPEIGNADIDADIVENISAKNSSLEIVDERSKIEDVFYRRKTLLERSCSFINQLKTANRIATIDELKEIHLVLHDLDASYESIAKRLKSYAETKISLDKNQEILSLNASR